MRSLRFMILLLLCSSLTAFAIEYATATDVPNLAPLSQAEMSAYLEHLNIPVPDTNRTRGNAAEAQSIQRLIGDPRNNEAWNNRSFDVIHVDRSDNDPNRRIFRVNIHGRMEETSPDLILRSRSQDPRTPPTYYFVETKNQRTHPDQVRRMSALWSSVNDANHRAQMVFMVGPGSSVQNAAGKLLQISQTSVPRPPGGGTPQVGNPEALRGYVHFLNHSDETLTPRNMSASLNSRNFVVGALGNQITDQAINRTIPHLARAQGFTVPDNPAPAAAPTHGTAANNRPTAPANPAPARPQPRWERVNRALELAGRARDYVRPTTNTAMQSGVLEPFIIEALNRLGAELGINPEVTSVVAGLTTAGFWVWENWAVIGPAVLQAEAAARVGLVQAAGAQLGASAAAAAPAIATVACYAAAAIIAAGLTIHAIAYARTLAEQAEASNELRLAEMNRLNEAMLRPSPRDRFTVRLISPEPGPIANFEIVGTQYGRSQVSENLLRQYERNANECRTGAGLSRNRRFETCLSAFQNLLRIREVMAEPDPRGDSW